MPEATARVVTDRPMRYIEQTCKHLGHKLQTEVAASSGMIWHRAGSCALLADSDAIVLRATADTMENLAIVQDLVARHLLRFGAREGLTVTWSLDASQNG